MFWFSSSALITASSEGWYEWDRWKPGLDQGDLPRFTTTPVPSLSSETFWHVKLSLRKPYRFSLVGEVNKRYCVNNSHPSFIRVRSLRGGEMYCLREKMFNWAAGYVSRVTSRSPLVMQASSTRNCRSSTFLSNRDNHQVSSERCFQTSTSLLLSFLLQVKADHPPLLFLQLVEQLHFVSICSLHQWTQLV